jgi:hypothetical protein
MSLMNLTELANRYGSDKGTRANSRHRYTYIYDLLFSPLKDKDLVFVEIGLAIGGPEFKGRGNTADRIVEYSPSVAMWLDYFSRASIIGFDISDFSQLRKPRFTFVRGDSGSESDLKRLADAAPMFDVVIDDGSHASFHQQLALKVLWPKVAPGGIYIIEDLHWQSPRYEKSLPSVPKTAAFLASYFEEDSYLENRIFTAGDMARLKQEVFCATFFPTLNTALEPAKSARRLLKSVIRRRPSDTTVCVFRKVEQTGLVEVAPHSENSSYRGNSLPSAT